MFVVGLVLNSSGFILGTEMDMKKVFFFFFCYSNFPVYLFSAMFFLTLLYSLCDKLQLLPLVLQI